MPIVYDVEIMRDGGSFSSRRVVARQGGQVIFFLSVVPRDRERLRARGSVPADVPAPEECPTLSEVLSKVSGRPAALWEQEWGALEIRYIGDSRPGGALVDPTHPARARVWVRVGRGPAGRPATAPRARWRTRSDLTLLSATTVPHSVVLIGLTVQAASLDHAMWFHRPFRADEWLLYDQVSPSASSGLGLATARLFQHDTLVANVAQEGLIRPMDGRRRAG